MAPEFSLAHLTLLGRSPAELIEIACRTGYDYVSLRLTPVTSREHVSPLVTDAVLRREIKQHLATTGVRLLDIELARMGPGDKPESLLKFLEAGAELGARHVICQLPDNDRARAADRFSRLCELAQPFGLTIDLEFPSFTELHDLDGAAQIVGQAGHNNAGLLVDTLHFARSDSTLAQLSGLPRDWFHFAQLCDADAAIPDSADGLIFTARHEREFLGAGGINVAEIVSAMPRVPYSLEIPNDKLRQTLGDENYARRALDAAKHYFLQLDTSNVC